MSWRWVILATVLTGAMFGAGWGIGRWRQRPPQESASPRRGALLFQTHCASCHGPDGHGDGSASAGLRPPPRDFAERPWRFEPTIASIGAVTQNGIPGTGMPAFKEALAEGDLAAVAAHVRDLATRGPIIERRPSERERRLREAGFIDLAHADPPAGLFVDPAGKSVSLKDWRGKLVILHFWGVGCVHCVEEMPALHELEKKHAGKLAVVHVCANDDDPAAAAKILNRHAPGATGYSDPTGLALIRFEAQTLPTVWLIGADGKAIARSTGARDWRSEPMKQLIANLSP